MITLTLLPSVYQNANDVIGWENIATIEVDTNKAAFNAAYSEIYINFGKWLDAGGYYSESPTQWKQPAFYYKFDATTVTNVFIPMDFIGAFANTNQHLIATAEIKIYKPGPRVLFKINIYYKVVSDYLNYQNGSDAWSNREKLLRVTKDSTTDLDFAPVCAFNDQKTFRTRMYVVEAATTDISAISQDFLTAQPRFWNKGNLGVAAPLTNPVFSLERFSVPVFDLSSVDDTKLTFTITGAYTLLHFGIFRTDIDNLSPDFIDSQFLSQAAIPSLLPPVFLGLSVPNFVFVAPAGATFAHVSAGGISPGATYRICAYCTVAAVRYAFLSEEFTVSFEIPIIPPTVSSWLADVESEKNTNWLLTSPLERLRGRTVWDGAPYNANKAVLFASALTSIKVTIYKVEVIGADTFKHVLEQFLRVRNAFTAFTAANLITVNITGQIVEMFYTWFNRNDPSEANLVSYKNGLLLPIPASNQDWNNSDIFIDWELLLNQPNAIVSQVDRIVYTQKITVSDYTNTLVFEIKNGAILQGDFICNDQVSTCVKVFNGSDFADWLIQESTFTKSLTEREETFVTFIGLPPLETPKYLPTPDPTFVANASNACLDNFLLKLNIPYKVGMITKTLPLPCLDADANALTFEMGLLGFFPDAAREALICQTITELKACGVWAKLRSLWIFAAHEESIARINWVNPALFTNRMVPIAGAQAGFTVDRGYAKIPGASLSFGGGAQSTTFLVRQMMVSTIGIYNNLPFQNGFILDDFLGGGDTGLYTIFARNSEYFNCFFGGVLNEEYSDHQGNFELPMTKWGNSDFTGFYLSQREVAAALVNLVFPATYTANTTLWKNGINVQINNVRKIWADQTGLSPIQLLSDRLLAVPCPPFVQAPTVGGRIAALITTIVPLNSTEHACLNATIQGYMNAVGAQA